jgi:hypothetical protein
MKDTTGSKSAGELVRELAEAGAMDVRSSLQEIVSHQSSFCVVTGKNRDIVCFMLNCGLMETVVLT